MRTSIRLASAVSTLLVALSASLTLTASLGCNSTPITHDCATVARMGAAPHCTLTAQCSGTNVGVFLDCTGTDGNCVCTKDGVTGKTVPFQDSFCTGGTAGDPASFENSLETANSACDWQL